MELIRKVNLTAEQLREVVDYDPATGEFRWKANRKDRIGRAVGRIQSGGYRQILIGETRYMAHRLAWLYMTGAWPAHTVDHRNGIRDDNRWHNLRDATQGENCQNQRQAHANSKSGMLGASWHAPSRKWMATIKVNGKKYFLGRFTTREAAHQAYLDAKARLHPFQTIVPMGAQA